MPPIPRPTERPASVRLGRARAGMSDRPRHSWCHMSIRVRAAVRRSRNGPARCSCRLPAPPSPVRQGRLRFDCRQPPLQLVAASRQEAQELPHGRRHSHACACYYWMSPLTPLASATSSIRKGSSPHRPPTRRGLHRGARQGFREADGQAAPGRHPHAVRLAGHRPGRRHQPGARGARPEARRQDRQDHGARRRRGARSCSTASTPRPSSGCATGR